MENQSLDVHEIFFLKNFKTALKTLDKNLEKMKTEFSFGYFWFILQKNQVKYFLNFLLNYYTMWKD